MLDYIVAACLDYCRNACSASGDEASLVKVQAKGIEVGSGSQSVVAALHRAGFCSSAQEGGTILDGDYCTSQAEPDGWVCVAMQRGLL